MIPSVPCSPACGCAASANARPALDLAAARARLASSAGGGKKYWRSLEAAAETPEFHEWLHREYPAGSSEWPEGQSRRDFLKLMAASFALAGMTACTRQPQEKILPYVKQPEELVQGIPLQYATAMTIGGYATGLLVESHEGRPTKIEGNPDHPMSLGAANVFHQASVLELYDPERTCTVLRAGEVSSWDEFMGELVSALAEQRPKAGAGLRILTETVTSPTLLAQIGDLLKKFPQARWHQYEPWSQDASVDYDFSKAKLIVALDSDFLFTHPASLAYARQFAKGRNAVAEAEDPAKATMSRLYVAEPTPTITGSMADHRVALSASDVGKLTQDGGVFPERIRFDVLEQHAPAKSGAWLINLKKDIAATARGESLIIAGEGQPREVHEAVARMNETLGNVGKTVFYRQATTPVPQSSLQELASAMHAGQVDLLVQIGGNAAYSAPADLDFAKAMDKVKRNVHLGLFYNETAQRAQWHLPEAHYLESWGDARAFDGTVSVMQPLIMPLYEGRTAYELLDMLGLEQTARGAYDIVRGQWQATHPKDGFEKAWRKVVHNGLAADTASPTVGNLAPSSAKADAFQEVAPDALELVFKPDYTVWDGRFCNNGWLQETPKPITKLTWDNAALLSPRLAERLGVANEDVVELTFQGRSVHAPVWITPGQAENSVTLHLGYGRTAAGSVGSGQGVNAYALRTSDAMGFGVGLEIKKVPNVKWELANAQNHHSTEGRDVYRTGTLEEYRKNPSLTPEKAEEPGAEDTLYPPDHTYPGYAWGMAIDLNTCIGCNACTVACQAENNIPIVGKGEVIRGREMHWIRVDGYYAGENLDNPEFYHQPVPCMHCENAPCEVVCPVAATVHNPEGLNEQVYNRCIGTRYCSNNCPYKVRRFNFVQYADNVNLTVKMQRNPDVSVRSRGIMEKCTFCVQRINEAKITSQKADRKLQDGEIQTACQQTCPTQAIVFGDVNDPNSRVSRLKKQPRNFGMLADLNTKPRTTYLARITNPA